MEVSARQISDLRLRLRTLKGGSDGTKRAAILAEITALGERSEQLVPDLIAAIKRYVYFPTAELIPVIIQSKSAELLDVARDQNHGRWPLNSFERCDLLRAGFYEFQRDLVEELIEVYDNDAEPRRSAIVDVLAEVGTASALEMLEAIEYQIEQKTRMVETDSDASSADVFLEKVRRAISLVSARPEPVANEEIAEKLAEEPEPVLAHVLFIDVVGYSKQPMDKQRDIINQLTKVVDDLRIVKRFRNKNGLCTLPTGDGMALVFFGSEIKPHVDAAIDLHKALAGNEEIRLRAGIHTGPVHRVIDINRKSNVSGVGINVAQRVMDCGDAGHILVSKAVAEMLIGLGGWENCLEEVGVVTVKHNTTVHLFNLSGEGFGNPAPPKKSTDASKASSDFKWENTVTQEEVYPTKEIVRAWFDDAINPLIEDLKDEEERLADETWKWSHKHSRFQEFHYISPASSEGNKEDFLDQYPTIVELLELHDTSLTNLNDRGEALFRELTQNRSFRDAYCKAARPEALLELREKNPNFRDRGWAQIFSELFPSKSDESIIAMLAEFSMNRRILENHFCMFPFWNVHKQTFIDLVSPCETYPAVVHARQALLRVVRQVITTLKAERRALSVRYGVPVESTSRNEENPFLRHRFGYL